jgi:hypothetical protein
LISIGSCGGLRLGFGVMKVGGVWEGGVVGRRKKYKTATGCAAAVWGLGYGLGLS